MLGATEDTETKILVLPPGSYDLGQISLWGIIPLSVKLE